MLFWLTIFLLSITVLLLSARRFLEAAEELGAILRLPPFLIGVLLLGFGTSLPEFATSAWAVAKSTPSADTTVVVIGTVVGSNIANIFLILALAAVVGKELVIRRLFDARELVLLLASTALLTIVMLNRTIVWWEGLILLAGFGLYLRFLVRERRELLEQQQQNPKSFLHTIFPKHQRPIVLPIVALVVSSLILSFAGKFTVDALLGLAAALGIGVGVLAASLVAIGTSLPELVVTLNAVRKKNAGLAFGNIVGSNIFNGLMIPGVLALTQPLRVSSAMFSVGIPFLLGATVLCTLAAFRGQLKRWQGILGLLLFAFFLARLLTI